VNRQIIIKRNRLWPEGVCEQGAEVNKREKGDLLTEKLHNFGSSPNITRIMKSKSIRQMAYVASTTHMKTAYKTLI
jgi:hypothetical protein